MIDTSGSPTSVEAVYRAERLGLVRLAFLLTGERDTAEDLVHSVFVEAHDRWHKIDQPVPYLRRALVSRAIDHQRRRARALPAEPERVAAAPELDETWHAVQRLTSRQRTIVVLRFYLDLSTDQIAEVLGRPSGTVRSDLHRALTTLRSELT
jgi:RNA polymerase sigma-70 factor (sigma-E family)